MQEKFEETKVMIIDHLHIPELILKLYAFYVVTLS
jgi:hypothetical protein